MKPLLRYWLLPIVALAGLTFVTFGEIRHYFFTDVDTFSLINDGRSQTVSAVIAHFSSELMGGRMVNGVFYRPLTSITFGAAYALFGLDPRGYHILNLVLCGLTALLMLAIAQRIWGVKRGTGIGLLAAVLFVLHPLQLDAVPATARLGDLLFTFFTLLSLTCMVDFVFVRASRIRRAVALGLSAVCAGLAFLAKEPGILVPFIVGLAVFLFSEQPAFSRRVRRSLLLVAPHCAVIGATVLWRWHVLHGIGGYVGVQRQFLGIRPSSIAAKTAILGHTAGTLFGGMTDSYDRYGAAFLAEHKILIFPLFAVSMALLGMMVYRSGVDVALVPYRTDEEAAQTDQRAAWLFAGLVAMHFCLLVVTGFVLRYLYFALPAFAFLLALAITRTCARVSRRQAASGGAALLIMILGVMYWHSPVWSKERLRRWQMSGEVARTILTDLEQIVRTGDKKEIFLLNLPESITFGHSTYIAEIPNNQLLLDHSVLDYLDLRGLGPQVRRADVIVLNYLIITGPPDDLQIRSEFVSPSTLEVSVSRGGVPTEYPWPAIAGRRKFDGLFRTAGGRRLAEKEPPEGYSTVMTIELSPRAMTETPRGVYAYDGRGLQEVTPFHQGASGDDARPFRGAPRRSRHDGAR